MSSSNNNNTNTFIKRNNVLIGVGALTTVLLGWWYMRRRSAAKNNAASGKGPDGEQLIKGLVFYPTENFWGTRPATKWNFNDSNKSASCSTMVPITNRNDDTLVAIASVVEGENIISSSLSNDNNAAKSIIEKILTQRNTSNSDVVGVVSKYDIETLATYTRPPPKKGKNNNNKAQQQGINFCYSVKAAGNAFGQEQQMLRVFLYFCQKTNSLVELVFSSSEENKSIDEIISNVYLTPSGENQGSAQFVSTIPKSASRVTVPASSWRYAQSEVLCQQQQSSSGSDSSSSLSLVADDIQSQLEKAVKQSGNKVVEVSKMSAEEVEASPKCATSVVQKELGVQFPAVADASVLEPMFSGTGTLALILNKQIAASSINNNDDSAANNKKNAATGAASSMIIMSFEKWTDAPESWYTSNNLTKEEIDRNFLREVRMMFLPVTVQTCVGPALLSVCGHEDVAQMEAEMDGRRVRFYVFRRPSPSSLGKSNNNNNNNSTSDREILVVRQEADAENFSEDANPFFRKMMESCLIAR